MLETYNPALTRFFELEVEDYRINVRNGNIDPADGFHPTLVSALDSIEQAPHDVRLNWLADEGEDENEQLHEALFALIRLAFLIAEHGPDTALIDFTEG